MPEFELLDTGVFDGGRYFDVVIEYAKATVEDTCVRVTVHNRGPEAAEFHLIPQLWFRNRWAWEPGRPATPRITPGDDCLVADEAESEPLTNLPFVYRLGKRYLYVPPGGRMLFTDNETNALAVFGPHAKSRSLFTKDAFHRHIIHKENCVNRLKYGTKAGVHYGPVTIPASGEMEWRFRLTDTLALPARSVSDGSGQPSLTLRAGNDANDPLADVDSIIEARRAEADEFYDRLAPPGATADERLIQRQALAGLIWSKQIYLSDVFRWQLGDDPRPACGRRPGDPQPALAAPELDAGPVHAGQVGVPWFAAWDSPSTPFRSPSSTGVREGTTLALLFEQFQHPNGQIPAYSGSSPT